MSQNFGVVIAGAGRFGTLHARVWAEAGAAVHGVVDVDASRAQQLAESIGAHAWGTDLPIVLDQSAARAVIVATDEATHTELATAALEAGVSVFIEKPFALDAASAIRTVELAEARGLHAIAGHISRFAQPYQYARSAIAAGRLGKVWSVRLRRDFSRAWYEDFGHRVHPAWESCVHDVDLALFLTGATPTRVFVTTSMAAGDAHPSVLSALVEFDTGQTATIESAWAVPDRAPQNQAGALALDGTIAAECEVIGSAGVIKQRLVSDALVEWNDQGTAAPDLSLWPESGGQVAGALRAEVDAALQVFTGRAENSTMPHEQAVAGVRLVEAIVESANTREPVVIAQS